MNNRFPESEHIQNYFAGVAPNFQDDQQIDGLMAYYKKYKELFEKKKIETPENNAGTSAFYRLEEAKKLVEKIKNKETEWLRNIFGHLMTDYQNPLNGRENLNPELKQLIIDATNYNKYLIAQALNKYLPELSGMWSTLTSPRKNIKSPSEPTTPALDAENEPIQNLFETKEEIPANFYEDQQINKFIEYYKALRSTFKNPSPEYQACASIFYILDETKNLRECLQKNNEHMIIVYLSAFKRGWQNIAGIRRDLSDSNPSLAEIILSAQNYASESITQAFQKNLNLRHLQSQWSSQASPLVPPPPKKKDEFQMASPPPQIPESEDENTEQVATTNQTQESTEQVATPNETPISNPYNKFGGKKSKSTLTILSKFDVPPAPEPDLSSCITYEKGSKGKDKPLDSGGFGVVYKCRIEEPLLSELRELGICPPGENVVVVKKILTEEGASPSDEEIQNFVREGNIAEALRAQFIDSHTDGPAPYNLATLRNYNGQYIIFSRYEEHGKIEEYHLTESKNNPNYATAPATKALVGKQLMSIMLGVKKMHDAGFFHRDIAGRNILVNENGEARIADFGLAVPIANSDAYTKKTDTGPLKYMDSLELIQHIVVHASDILKVKIALLEIEGAAHGMSTGEVLNDDASTAQIGGNTIAFGEGTTLKEYLGLLPKKAKDKNSICYCFKDFLTAGFLSKEMEKDPNAANARRKLDYLNFIKGCVNFAKVNKEFNKQFQSSEVVKELFLTLINENNLTQKECEETLKLLLKTPSASKLFSKTSYEKSIDNKFAADMLSCRVAIASKYPQFLAKNKSTIEKTIKKLCEPKELATLSNAVCLDLMKSCIEFAKIQPKFNNKALGDTIYRLIARIYGTNQVTVVQLKAIFALSHEYEKLTATLLVKPDLSALATLLSDLAEQSETLEQLKASKINKVEPRVSAPIQSTEGTHIPDPNARNAYNIAAYTLDESGQPQFDATQQTRTGENQTESMEGQQEELTEQDQTQPSQTDTTEQQRKEAELNEDLDKIMQDIEQFLSEGEQLSSSIDSSQAKDNQARSVEQQEGIEQTQTTPTEDMESQSVTIPPNKINTGPYGKITDAKNLSPDETTPPPQTEDNQTTEASSEQAKKNYDVVPPEFRPTTRSNYGKPPPKNDVNVAQQKTTSGYVNMPLQPSLEEQRKAAIQKRKMAMTTPPPVQPQSNDQIMPEQRPRARTQPYDDIGKATKVMKEEAARAQALEEEARKAQQESTLPPSPPPVAPTINVSSTEGSNIDGSNLDTTTTIDVTGSNHPEVVILPTTTAIPVPTTPVVKKLDPALIPETEFQKLYDDIVSKTLPVQESPKNEFKLADKPVSDLMSDTHERIKSLQKSGFQIYTSGGKEFLVKYNPNGPIDDFNPFHSHETDIQALRYVRAMLIIAENSDPAQQREILSQMEKDYNKYVEEIAAINAKEMSPKSAKIKALADKTHDLAENFAQILREQLGLKEKEIGKARKQLVMARDLGLLLEEHPAVCTISESDVVGKDGKVKNKVTIEQSAPLKIRETYYDKFKDIRDNKWFKHAKTHAGFKKKAKGTWLENFFTKKANIDKLKENGLPALSSSRWLPLPANNHRSKIHVAELEGGKLKNGDTTQFIRMGITTAYNIDDTTMQDRLAVDQLRELFKDRIKLAIDEYKAKYGAAANDQPFYVDYQTLLTPITGEQALFPFGLTDNNYRFVRTAAKAMKEIAKEYAAEGNQIDGIELKFRHTNAPINKRAHWPNVKTYSESAIRAEKIKDTIQLISSLLGIPIQMTKDGKITPNGQIILFNNASAIEKGELRPELSPSLRQEIARRMRAAGYLQQAMEKQPPYDSLPPYQRNLMLATLEFLTLGSQAITLSGCKSAKDRTAVFAAAVKTMMENPEAMYNWEVLNKGIIRALMQGHNFRAMLWHSAIVKINAVHPDYTKQFPPETQETLETLKRFNKKMESPEKYQKIVAKKAAKKAKKAEKQAKKAAKTAPEIGVELPVIDTPVEPVPVPVVSEEEKDAIRTTYSEDAVEKMANTCLEMSVYLLKNFKESDLRNYNEDSFATLPAIAASGNLTLHVIEEILAKKSLLERSAAMEFYTAVLEKSIGKGDFHTAYAIFMALNSKQIRSLSKAREGLSPNAKQIQAAAIKLFQNHKFLYESILERTKDKTLIPDYGTFHSLLESAARRNDMEKFNEIIGTFMTLRDTRPETYFERSLLQQAILEPENKYLPKPHNPNAPENAEVQERLTAAAKAANEIDKAQKISSIGLTLVKKGTLDLDTGMAKYLEEQKVRLAQKQQLLEELNKLTSKMFSDLDAIQTYQKLDRKQDEIISARSKLLGEILGQLNNDPEMNATVGLNSQRLTIESLEKRIALIKRVIDSKEGDDYYPLRIHHPISRKKFENKPTKAITLLTEFLKSMETVRDKQNEYNHKSESLLDNADTYEKMDKDIKQNAVIIEFYDTEKTFRNNMNSLVDNFFQGDELRPDAAFVKKDPVTHHSDSLDPKEREFLTQFLTPYQKLTEDRLGPNPDNLTNEEKIGKIVNFIKNDLADTVAATTAITVNYDLWKHYLIMVGVRHGGFEDIESKVTQTTEMDTITKQAIDVLTIQATQRLIRYEMLLKELLSTIDAVDNPGLANKVYEAYKLVQEHSRALNEAKRAAEKKAAAAPESTSSDNSKRIKEELETQQKVVEGKKSELESYRMKMAEYGKKYSEENTDIDLKEKETWEERFKFITNILADYPEQITIAAKIAYIEKALKNDVVATHLHLGGLKETFGVSTSLKSLLEELKSALESIQQLGERYDRILPAEQNHLVTFEDALRIRPSKKVEVSAEPVHDVRWLEARPESMRMRDAGPATPIVEAQETAELPVADLTLDSTLEILQKMIELCNHAAKVARGSETGLFAHPSVGLPDSEHGLTTAHDEVTKKK